LIKAALAPTFGQWTVSITGFAPGPAKVATRMDDLEAIWRLSNLIPANTH
jgi:hypothetical protein